MKTHIELIIVLVMFSVRAATNSIKISPDSFLRYFAIFDDVMYPATNRSIGSTSHVTLETCAELCLMKSKHETLTRHSVQTVGENSNVLHLHPEMPVSNRTPGVTVPSEHEDSCFAFEYISLIGYCILLQHSAGQRSLKPATGTTFFELSRPALDLFQKWDNAVLDGQYTYQIVKNASSVTNCAETCMLAADITCNSFAYSERMRICGISSFVPEVGFSLHTTETYDYYQYSGEWLCNVTLPWYYKPRVIATQRYPYVYHGRMNCHFRLVAPPGQEVVLHVTTFFTNQTVCKDGESGVFVFDGDDQTAKASGALCQTNDKKRRPTFKSSNGTLFVTISQSKGLVIAKMFYSYERHVSNCATSPCLFNAVCVETDYSYKCICPHGTTGNRCERYIGECYHSPCMNGTCYPSSSGSGYRCACVKGFTGRNCEYNINECFSSPCLNGRCEDHVNGYKCICKEPYTGRHCEVNKSLASCIRNLCRFGTCAVNETGSYCQCFPGFTGFLCETNIDECEESPCAHGDCVDHVNSYQCICSSGYAGKHCDILVDDPCRGNPCNHGYCSIINKEFSCICDSGYTGSKCESELTVCQSTCFHGYCIKVNTNDSKCICSRNFIGKYCNRIIADCNDGTCKTDNISNTPLPNKSATLLTTYKPVQSQTLKLYNTSKLSTPILVKHQTISVSSMLTDRFALQTLKNTLSTSPSLFQQFSTKGNVAMTEPSLEITNRKHTITFPTLSTYTSTKIVPTVTPLAAKYLTSDSISMKQTLRTKPSLRIISTDSGFRRESSRKFSRETTIYTNQNKGNKTIRTTRLYTAMLKTPPLIEMYTTDIQPNTLEHSSPNQMFTKEKKATPTFKTLLVKLYSTDKTLSTARTERLLSHIPETVSAHHTSTQTILPENKTTKTSGRTTSSSFNSSKGENVNGVITIESIVIGALFVALVIVLAMALFAFYKRARSGTVYITTSEPPAQRDNPAVKKRYSASEIHAEHRSGKLLTPRCVSSQLYQRQDDSGKPFYSVPRRRHDKQVSPDASTTTSPVSSLSGSYDEVESPALVLPSRIRRLVPLSESADRTSVLNITRGKGVITPRTPEYERPKQIESLKNDSKSSSFSARDVNDSSVTTNENPFFKREDGSVWMNLHSGKHSKSEQEMMSLLAEILDGKDKLILGRPGTRKSLHYISGTENGKSEA